MSVFVRTPLLLAFCCICSKTFGQQDTFSWLDNKINLHWRINLPGHSLEQEVLPDQWKEVGIVKMVNVDSDELPNKYLTNSFLPNNSNFVFFTVIGTGQVYKFDNRASTLTRLDKTFYRGYKNVKTRQTSP